MKNQKGFTLIEMLVVVAIIGLLSSVVVVGLGSSRSKARDAKRIADIRQIQTALELGYNSVIGYPASIPTGAATRDPRNISYSYATSTGLGYKLGICLENTEGTTGATNCPAGVSCTGQEYCVSQSGQ